MVFEILGAFRKCVRCGYVNVIKNEQNGRLWYVFKWKTMNRKSAVKSMEEGQKANFIESPLENCLFNICWQNNIHTRLPFAPFIRNHFSAVIFIHCLYFGKCLNIELAISHCRILQKKYFSKPSFLRFFIIWRIAENGP